MLIDEAVDNGARLFKAANVIGIKERTYFIWRKLSREFNSYEDRRKYAGKSSNISTIHRKSPAFLQGLGM